MVKQVSVSEVKNTDRYMIGIDIGRYYMRFERKTGTFKNIYLWRGVKSEKEIRAIMEEASSKMLKVLEG